MSQKKLKFDVTETATSEQQQAVTATGPSSSSPVTLQQIESLLDKKMAELKDVVKKEMETVNKKLDFLTEFQGCMIVAHFARLSWGLIIPVGVEPCAREFGFNTKGPDAVSESIIKPYLTKLQEWENIGNNLVTDGRIRNETKFFTGKEGVQYNALGFAHSVKVFASGMERKIKTPQQSDEPFASHLTCASKMFPLDKLPNSIIIAEISTSKVSYNQTADFSKHNDDDKTTYRLLRKLYQLQRQVFFAKLAFEAENAQLFAAFYCPMLEHSKACGLAERLLGHENFKKLFSQLAELHAIGNFKILVR